MQDRHPTLNIITGVLWIGCNAEKRDKFTVTHGSLERLIIGLYQGLDDKQHPGREDGLKSLALLAETLKAGGSGTEVTEKIQTERFIKNCWNCVLSSFCALAGATVSEAFAPDMAASTIASVGRVFS